MSVKKKKLEILFIDDIRSMNNDLLSVKSNHYLQNMLFVLRLLFRYNDEGLDDFVDFYYYVENILDNKILLDFDELKILIYRVTDLVVNMEDYDVRGSTLITETCSNLLQSLYLELETYRLVDKTEDIVWKDIIVGQLKDQLVDFNSLIHILEICDDDRVTGCVLDILENNYPFEYAIYKARNGILLV